ncbi:hypothetical protein Q3G72_025492 [Acer saccharum]|nr:hypothetical protein Q3G72_025492 [Acer saccharum]
MVKSKAAKSKDAKERIARKCFYCVQCNRWFTLKGYKEHLKSSVHKNQTNICHICGNKFRFSNELYDHRIKEPPTFFQAIIREGLLLHLRNAVRRATRKSEPSIVPVTILSAESQAGFDVA